MGAFLCLDVRRISTAHFPTFTATATYLLPVAGTCGVSANLAPWAETVSSALSRILPTPLVLDITCAAIAIVGATVWLGIWSYLAG